IGGPLYNPDHDHIAELLHDNEEFLAFAWASSAYKSKQAMVLGQCEKVMFNVGGWRKARQEQQMRDWFGFVPTYLITVDASFCERANDTEFCYLLEHELYHIGVERDDDGEMIFSSSTGLPKHYLAGHDVEEFIGVTKRWGASQSVKRIVEAAKNPPFVSNLDISKCCGNCVIN
ncbi:putative metallopeptidase, partial [Acinetobacter baumannii]